MLLVDATTRRVRVITPPGVLDPQSWSRDGSVLLFSRAIGVCAVVEVVGADGSGLRQLTDCAH